MKIRLIPADVERLGVPEVMDFDFNRIGLREAAALQKATDVHPEDISKELRAENSELLAGIVWLAVGRALGKRPPWDDFDIDASASFDPDVPDVVEDPEEGKDDASTETTSTSE